MFNTQKMDSVGDASSNYEDEAFESISMSKSMVGGIGLGLGAKKEPRKSVVSSSNAKDDYSNDGFESVTMSKSITVSASNKVVPSKKKIGNNLSVPDKKKGQFSNYSPIKEADEENRYPGEESKESRPSPAGDDTSETPTESYSASKSLS